MASFEVAAVFTAKDNASATIRKLTQEQDKLDRQVQDATDSFQKGEKTLDDYDKALRSAANESKKIERALKQVEGQSKETTEATTKLNSSFATLAKSAAVVAGLAAIGRALQFSGEQAIEQADAVAQLNTALKLTGDLTPEASEAINAFANALERSTGVANTVILQGVALAKSFGQTNTAAQELASAGLDFAAAASINYEEAVRRLGRATQGSTEDIAKFVPEIQNLTKAQLAAGEATRLIAERFDGFARDSASAFTTATTNAVRALENLAETTGKGVIENQEFTDSIEGLAVQLNILAESTGATGRGIGTLSATVTDFFAGLLQGLNNLRAGRQGFEDLDTAVVALDDDLDKATETVRKFLIEQGQTGEAASRISENFRTLAAALGDTNAAFEGLIRNLEREKRLSDEAALSTQSLEKNLKQLGITLDSDVQRAIDRNNAVLDTLRNNYSITSGGAQEFARIQDEVRLINEGLANSIGKTIDQYGRLTEQQATTSETADTLTSSLVRQEEQLKRTRSETNSLTTANNNLIRSVGTLEERFGSLTQTEQRRRNLSGQGRTTNFDISGGTFQSTTTSGKQVTV